MREHRQWLGGVIRFEKVILRLWFQTLGFVFLNEIDLTPKRSALAATNPTVPNPVPPFQREISSGRGRQVL